MNSLTGLNSMTSVNSLTSMNSLTALNSMTAMNSLTASITIRPGYADDQRALERLAALDSAATPPPAPRLLAEVDGELRAALSLSDGSVIADPFFATAELVALLRAHAAAGSRRRASRGVRGRLPRLAFG